MHNCKTTRDRLIEQVLDGADASTAEALVELQACNECRDEFEAAKAALRVTTRMIDAATPADEYWSGYHGRLRQKLSAANAAPVVTPKSSWVLRLFTTSVRMPLPVPAALTLALGALLFLVLQAPAPVPPAAPIIVEVPLQVPVVREKEVTRIIYRNRYQRPLAQKTRHVTDPTGEALARSQKDGAGLTGFKPLEEIKLTIIKGGSGNDK